jgi:hypothetical protein
MSTMDAVMNLTNYANTPFDNHGYLEAVESCKSMNSRPKLPMWPAQKIYPVQDLSVEEFPLMPEPEMEINEWIDVTENWPSRPPIVPAPLPGQQNSAWLPPQHQAPQLQQNPTYHQQQQPSRRKQIMPPQQHQPQQSKLQNPQKKSKVSQFTQLKKRPSIKANAVANTEDTSKLWLSVGWASLSLIAWLTLILVVAFGKYKN